MSGPSDHSFRDRHSGVQFSEDRVIRSFDDAGSEWFLKAHDSGLFAALCEAGLLVDYEIASTSPLIVESPRLPIVTYPYEWSPTMLRDAGLVTLEIAKTAWDQGFHLRDASAFNIVFSSAKPVMVDLGSFKPGHTKHFLAYGQFCDHFLNPLAVSESLGVSSKSLWLGVEGLPAELAAKFMRTKALAPKYARHIWARARLERNSESLDADERLRIRADFGLPPDAIRKSLESLHSLLKSLEPRAGGSWGNYEVDCSYEVEATETKVAFVKAAAERVGGKLALDIGANTGHYSGALAPHFETVVAVEPDESAVDQLYRRVRSGALAPNVVPMVIDIGDPPGGRGFRNQERPAALSRIAGADLVIWLAVIHHLVIGGNLPLPMIFDLAASLAPNHVFEHVSPSDPMSELLLASRDEIPWPMDRDYFETELRKRFDVAEMVDVTPTRRLYFVSQS